MKANKKWSAGVLALILLLPLGLAGCGVRGGEDAPRNSYQIEAAYSEGSRAVTAAQAVRYINRTGGALDRLCFNLYPNAYRADAKYKAVAMANRAKAYPRGDSWGRIDIGSVKVEGAPAAYAIEGDDLNILAVALPAGLPPEAAVMVEIGFTTVLAQVYDRLGYNDRTVHITNWYPVLCVWEEGAFSVENYSNYGDPFYSEVADYRVNFTCPDRYGVAHTGERTDTLAAGGNSTHVLTADRVRDFAIMLSALKTTAARAADGLTVNYHYLTDKNFEENLELAARAMRTFSALFGAYPYPKIEIFEAPFAHGGMEYPGLIIVAEGLAPADLKEVIVHELAHQWWYAAVGNNQHSAAWLDEGLSDFSTLLFFKEYPEYGVDKDKRVRQSELNYALFVDVLKSLNASGDTTMTRRLADYGSEREYVFMTYVKGMLMFETLYKTLGEKTFLRCIQRFYSENLYKIAHERDMIAAFEKAAHRKLEGFFRSWLDGKVVIARLVA